jgi:hypothetical protein
MIMSAERVTVGDKASSELCRCDPGWRDARGQAEAPAVGANLEGMATSSKRQFSELNNTCTTAEIKAPSTAALAAVPFELWRWPV